MKLVPLVSIHVQREGKLIVPQIGKPFEFSDDEVVDMDTLSEKTKTEYYREPLNEASADGEKPKLTAAEKKAAAKAAADAAKKSGDDAL